jgi:3-hydroxyisobutyrate dehydrogenase/2-hydroxy-3-oxopropionate reductase
MSTVGPAAILQLASTLDDSRLLEAPVLGSISEAESGTLVIFMAGPPSLAESLRPMLLRLGSPEYVGPHGAGAAAKLVANLTLLGTVGVLGEAIALAEAMSLPLETTFKVLESTPLAAQSDRRKASITRGDYPTRFPLTLARKDAHLIQEAAAARHLSLPITAGVRRWLDEGASAGLGDADYSALLGYILSRASASIDDKG